MQSPAKAPSITIQLNACAHLLHQDVGLCERPDLCDVVALEVVERGGGLLQRGDRLGQRQLRLGLLNLLGWVVGVRWRGPAAGGMQALGTNTA